MSLSPSEISDTDTLNSTGLGAALPKVGQTRCYWSILTARLDFIYVDPVLSSHLGDQSTEVVGRNILDFVHPDERANARNDMSKILQERGLHGSVTRVRFCRLSTVKEKLGFDGPLPASTLLEQEFPDARKIVYDEHYMTCELVLNWAADHPDIAKFGGGVVLCFLHAAVDIDRVGDNDELRKTTWTNWCGTPLFENEHVDMLYGRLGTDALLSRPPAGGFLPSRIFQIFSSTPERAILFSWPLTTNSSDYSTLAEGIKIEPSVGARTGCQRRFQSRALVNEKSVESIFIPHGCIIFACHTINGGHSRPVPSPIETARSASPYYPQQQQQQPTENGAHSQGFYDSGYVYGSSMTSSRYQNQNANSGSSFAPLPPMATSEGDWPVSPSFSAPSPMGYHTQPSPIVEQGWSKRTPSPPDSAYPHPHPNAPSWDLPATSTNESNTNNARVRVVNRSHAGRSDQGHRVGPSVSTSASTPSTIRTPTAPASASAPLSGRASGNPPAGVIRCASCNTSQSPEWRKGPSGKKELCNACGLRFARSRAKKEGHQPQKRRKDEKPTQGQGQGQDGDGEEDPPTPPSGGSLSLNNPTAAAGVGGGERERRRTQTPSPPFGRYSTGQGQGQPRIDEEQGFSQFHGHGYSGHGHGYPHTQTSLYSSITGTGPASSNSSYTTLPRINSLDHTHTVTHAQDIYPPPSQSTLPPFGSRPAYDGGVKIHDHHHPQMYRGVAVGAPSSYERGMPSVQSGIRHS